MERLLASSSEFEPDDDGSFMAGVQQAKRIRLTSDPITLAPNETVPISEVSFEPNREISEVVVVETNPPTLDVTEESLTENLIGGDPSGDRGETSSSSSTPSGNANARQVEEAWSLTQFFCFFCGCSHSG